MIWLARKAFFGRVPFPAMHVDTGKKFPGDVRVPRSLRQGMGSRSQDRALPADRRRRSDLAAGRALRRAQDRRAEAGAHQIRLRRPDRRHPPRRGSDPRQGARVLAARHSKAAGTCATSRRNSGTSSTPRRRPARICASIRSCIGPRPTSGPTPSARTSRSSRFICRRTASAIARWAIRTSPIPVASTASSIDEILTELDGTKVPERAGRALDHETEDAFERLRVAGYL